MQQKQNIAFESIFYYLMVVAILLQLSTVWIKSSPKYRGEEQ